MARIVRVAGRTSADEVTLAAPVSIGRGDDNVLRLYDETASRHHAVLRLEGDRAVLEDLGSSNGTRVNGSPVRRTVLLSHGDEIAVGDVRLRYVSDVGGDRPTRVVALPETEEDATVEAAVDPAAADPARAGEGASAVARMRLLCRAAEAASGALDADRLARDLLDLLVEGLRPDRACVLLGRPGALRVAADHPPGSGAPPSSRTLLRRVAEEGEAVLVRDARGPEARRAHASLASSRYRATIAAPLGTVEGVAGLVTLESEEPHRFGREDLEVLAAVARQGALALRTLSALSTARAEARRLARPRETPAEILGSSPAIRTLLEQVDRAAASDATVLIVGETGTGKELVARRLHAGSPRRSGPFVALNCAALVEGLLESEMFGHEKGAFTGADARREGRIAQADGGTLFLDEVGELSPSLQAKLLRVLSDRTYSRVGGRDSLPMRCRLLAATHRDLKALVAQGRFREDLYYRLAVVVLPCPPLRERPGDVEVLAEALLERIAARLSRRVPALDEGAREALRAHAWPGNVREMENALERALVLSDAPVLSARDLPAEVRDRRTPGEPATPTPGEAIPMREAERRAVVAALAKTGGKKGEAASLLGISWPTLTRKMREFGL
jgi:transcriptional regulator with GAF, ATPase, and Fis domain